MTAMTRSGLRCAHAGFVAVSSTNSRRSGSVQAGESRIIIAVDGLLGAVPAYWSRPLVIASLWNAKSRNKATIRRILHVHASQLIATAVSEWGG